MPSLMIDNGGILRMLAGIGFPIPNESFQTIDVWILEAMFQL